jgi:hypothetical protein
VAAEKKEEEKRRKEYDEKRAELEAARDARVQPTDAPALIAYFFDTEMNEMAGFTL